MVFLFVILDFRFLVFGIIDLWRPNGIWGGARKAPPQIPFGCHKSIIPKTKKRKSEITNKKKE